MSHPKLGQRNADSHPYGLAISGSSYGVEDLAGLPSFPLIYRIGKGHGALKNCLEVRRMSLVRIRVEPIGGSTSGAL